MRHKAACQQERISDTSDSESDTEGEGTKQKVIDQRRNKNQRQVFHRNPGIQIQSEQDGINHQASGNSKDSDDHSILPIPKGSLQLQAAVHRTLVVMVKGLKKGNLESIIQKKASTSRLL